MESEREKLERQIGWLTELSACSPEHDAQRLDELLAEKRAALAALDGPADGYERITLYMDTVGWVWANPEPTRTIHAKIVADIPIPIVQVVRGKVQP